MPEVFEDTPWVRKDSLVVAHRLRTYYTIKPGLFAKPRYVKAVDDISLSIDRGITLAIVGESGSGKTTLGRTLIRLLEPISGEIYFDGNDITHMKEEELKRIGFRRRVSMVFQDPYSSLNPFHSIHFILEEPLMVQGVAREEREERIYRALEEVKLTPPEDFINKYPHMLSGGQRQRIAIARAIITNPDFIVADEPVSMLDASIRVEILTILKDIQQRHKMAFMYITHDISTAKYFSDYILIMYAGQFAEYGPFRDVVKNPLHPYAQSLIEAIPDPDPSNRLRERKVAPGEPPNLVNPPSGCRFHPRCPFAMDICKKQEPPVVEARPGVFVKCWLYVKR
ncbi:ABC transporter ATP-binding protein [Vulcanisaeta distributa]|uniref:ABC transporter ATP-binding protein n=1 Tax=Vulcanisaeta distributa TaxID=164451 RepID=UPI000AC9CF94|nr:ABC transporter ATP-binding protein [Vulcanisaeta distributa]